MNIFVVCWVSQYSKRIILGICCLPLCFTLVVVIAIFHANLSLLVFFHKRYPTRKKRNSQTKPNSQGRITVCIIIQMYVVRTLYSFDWTTYNSLRLFNALSVLCAIVIVKSEE